MRPLVLWSIRTLLVADNLGISAVAGSLFFETLIMFELLSPLLYGPLLVTLGHDVRIRTLLHLQACYTSKRAPSFLLLLQHLVTSRRNQSFGLPDHRDLILASQL